MQILHSNNAPEAVGPYCQAIVPNAPGVPVFLSGQVGIDPKTNKLVDGLKAQSFQAFENIKAVLAEAGLTLNDVVYANVLLANMDDFKEFNSYYADVFGDHRPTRAAYEAAGLPLNAEVEIVITAWKTL